MMATANLLELRKALQLMVLENRITNKEADDLLAKAGLTKVGDTYVDEAGATYSFK